MRVLWLHQYFATPKGWGAVRTYEFARRFIKAGHAVDVVCCAGYDDSLKPTGAEPVVTDGVRVFVSATAYRPHMGFLRRIVSFLSFMGYALWFMIRRGGAYDVVVASSGPLTLAVPALVAKWLWGTPFVFEVIDVWPDSAIAAGVLRSPVLKKLSFWLERMAYSFASSVVTCSTGMTERIERKLAKAARARGWPRVVTISNCCDLEQFVPDAEARQRMRERLGVGREQAVALYTGAMGVSNAVDDLLEAIRETNADTRLVWWVAGDGPRSKEVAEALAADGRHRFCGSMPKEDLVALYMAADVNVVTFMHAPLFYENSPNKFFDGIAAGLPAVFNRTTWLAPFLERYGCGIICNPAVSERRLSAALLGLAAEPTRLLAMRAGARSLAESCFSRDRLAEVYWDVLEKVARERGRGRFSFGDRA